MSMFYNLPLKALWIWNCNEAEIAIDFYLIKGGQKYQVKGSGIDAFNYEGDLKVCAIDNIDIIQIQKPTRPIYINEKNIQKKIWNYWKFESGEKRFNEVLLQHKKYQKSLEIPLFISIEESIINTIGEIELTGQQLNNLVFELEALLELQKALRGTVSKKQVEALLKVSTEGFSQTTISRVYDEIHRKGLI